MCTRNPQRNQNENCEYCRCGKKCKRSGVLNVKRGGTGSAQPRSNYCGYDSAGKDQRNGFGAILLRLRADPGRRMLGRR